MGMALFFIGVCAFLEKSPANIVFAGGLAGWDGWNRTITLGVKVRCPTTRLHPNINERLRGVPQNLSDSLGWKMGLEPTVSGATNRRFNRLSYIHHILARLKGFEPLTLCLEGRCSIQLSYRRITQEYIIPYVFLIVNM